MIVHMLVAFPSGRLRDRFSAVIAGAADFVVAEALTNARKHSNAREVAVRLDRTEGGGLRMDIRDDGVRVVAPCAS